MKHWMLCGIAVALLVMVAGCDESFIDPFENEDQYFTVYGSISPANSEHYVRVIPVTRTPENIETPGDDDALIDARVRSIDMATGTAHIWQHSLRRLSDGTYGHLFRARFVAHPGRTYKLEVMRSDSAMTTATTTIPQFSQAQAVEVLQAYRVEGDTLRQDVVIPGVPNVGNVKVLYFTMNNGQNKNHLVDYGHTGERTKGGSWRVTVDLTADAPYVKGRADWVNHPLYLDAMALEVEIVDETWNPPGGVLDPEILAQPNVLSNVENGYGFWGGIGVFRTYWDVETQLSLDLGYAGTSPPYLGRAGE